MVHTVVVVTGTVVGVVEVVGLVVAVVGGVVVVAEVPSPLELSSDEDVEVDVEVDSWSSDEDVVVLVLVEGTVTGVVTSGFAEPARYITATPDSTPEPTRRAWVMCRTRAKRRSRCWGVRVAGVMVVSHLTVLLVILKT